MNNTARVREIIPYLTYSKLRPILPKKALFTGIAIGGDFPNIVRTIGYPLFGLFIDYLIREMLTCAETGEDWETKIDDLCVLLQIEGKYRESIKAQIDYFRSIFSFICDNFWSVLSIKEPEIGVTSENNRIIGHPDIIIGDTIYDIKMTGNFNLMRKDSIFQLLSYYCLSKNNNLPVKCVGVILPAQKKVIRHNIKDWNWRPFFDELWDAFVIKRGLRPDPLIVFGYKILEYNYIGAHIPRGNDLFKTLQDIPKHIPVQVFLSGRTNTEIAPIKDAEKIKNLDKILYIHAPYTLNLSMDEEWVVTRTVQQLEMGHKLGAKGVVIHCGKTGKRTYREAYDNMLNNVNKITKKMKDAQTLLLIETSAGEKGELLSAPEELISFYSLLEDRNKVQICVDTCHVFSAGYEPDDFINILRHHNIPIPVIHFNDSKEMKGCCHDRHARIGCGFIGLEKLYKIAVQSIKNGIHLVRE